MTNKILNVVVAGIQKNDEWLLIKRKRGDYQKKWALVGGKMEFNEEIEEAIKREIEEETGLEVKFSGVVGFINERLLEDDEIKKQFLIILCKTEMTGGIKKQTEEGEVAWFKIDEIKKMKELIIPSDYFMIEMLLKKNRDRFVEVEMKRERGELKIKKKA